MDVDASYLSSSGDGAWKSSSSTLNKLEWLGRFSAGGVGPGIPICS